MKRFAVMFLIMLLFSCTRGRSPAPDAEAEALAYSHRNQGIYLPEYFIETLQETLSHMRSATMFYKLPNSENNIAIIIFESDVLFVYSFHEGRLLNIREGTDNELIMREWSHETRVSILDDCTIRNEAGIIFVNVNRGVDDWRSTINAYITNIIFGDTVYRNESDNKMFRLENGNISFRNIEYELEINTVFFHPEYDVLISKDGETREYVFFTADNDAINIYELTIPGEEGPLWARLGEYRLADVFR